MILRIASLSMRTKSIRTEILFKANLELTNLGAVGEGNQGGLARFRMKLHINEDLIRLIIAKRPHLLQVIRPRKFKRAITILSEKAPDVTKSSL